MKTTSYSTYVKVFAEHMARHPHNWHLDFYTVDTLKAAGAACLLNEAQTAGLILWPDGDDVEVRCLFNVGESGDGCKLLVQATEAFGATTLNCYDGRLVELYSEHGWVEDSRVWFEPAYANDRWNRDLHGMPDVVFMRHERNPEATTLPLTILNSPMIEFAE